MAPQAWFELDCEKGARRLSELGEISLQLDQCIDTIPLVSASGDDSL